jgi:NADPH:quinone reductase-like Zn-dependent oxidoreductase
VTSDRNVSILNVPSKPNAERLDALSEMFDAGQLKVRVEKSFPLGQAREAQQTVEHHHRSGEIALSVN